MYKGWRVRVTSVDARKRTLRTLVKRRLVSPEFDASVLLPLARAGTLICGWTFRAACHNGLPTTRTQVSFPAFANVRVHVRLRSAHAMCNRHIETLHATLHAPGAPLTFMEYAQHSLHAARFPRLLRHW